MSAKVTALLQPFNAQEFDPSQSAGQLPVGKHPVKIVDGEVKATKNNDGGYLQLSLQIIDGPMTGTTGPYRLNLYNSNAQTAEIAHRQLSALAHITGVLNVQDVRQLFNIPFIVEVGPQKNDPQYTEVKRVYDFNGNEPGKQGQPPAQGQATQGFGNQPVQQAAPQQGNPAFGTQAPTQQAPWGQQAPQHEAAPAQAYNAGSYAEKSGPYSNPGQPAAPEQQFANPNVPQQAAAPWGQPAAQAPQQAFNQAPAQQAAAWGQPSGQPAGAAPWGR